MLDIKFIRENAELVKEAAQKKNISFDVAELLSADDNRKAILAEVEAMRSKQNEIADAVPRAENTEAREKLKTLILNKKVQLKDTVTDDYGRILANVYADDTFVNKVMLMEGLALYTYAKNPGNR